MDQGKPQLKFLSLELTNNCDQCCTHCYVDAAADNKNKLDFKQWLQIIKDAKEIGCQEIRLTGGEPSLSPFFFKIIQTAHQLGLKIGFNTHGAQAAKAIKKIIQFKPDKIFISFEGAAENDAAVRGQKHFAKAISNAIKLRRAGLDIIMNIHLRKSNFHDIDQLVKIALKNKFVLKFPFLRPIGRARKYLLNEILNPEQALEIAQKIEIIKKTYPQLKITCDYQLLGEAQMHMLNHCPAGQSSIHINPDGAVYPCGFMRAAEFLLGNIKDHSLSEIWTKSTLLAQLRKKTGADRCQSCKFFGQKCSGPARCLAYFVNKNLFADDPICFSSILFPSRGLDHLPQLIKILSLKERQLFNNIFNFEITEQNDSYKLISLNNKIENTQIIYNTASRLGRKDGMRKLKRIRKVCDNNNKCRICKRGKNKIYYLDAIPGPYYKHHKVLFFKKHDPTQLDSKSVAESLQAAGHWFKQESQALTKKQYYIFWNTLIGSEIHGHAHLICQEGDDFALFKNYLQKTVLFEKKYKVNYFDSLYSVHNSLGLTGQEGQFKYFMNLVPKSSREVFIFGRNIRANEANASLAKIISQVCQNWIARAPYNVPAISIFINYSFSPREKDNFVLARIVDRRFPLIGKIDRGTIEEFAFQICTHDPFIEWEKIKLKN